MKPLPISLLAFCSILKLCCAAPRPIRFDTPTDYFPDTPAVSITSEQFSSGDGRKLTYLRYGPIERSDSALIYLNGIESHAGWFEGTARRLAAAGRDVYCLDRRGSGINRENAGFRSGDVDSYRTLIADVGVLADSLRERYAFLHLTGLSWGGKLALGVVLEHPERFDSLMLITPGIRSKVDVSSLTKLGIAICWIFYPRKMFALPIKAHMFSRQTSITEKIETDPLRLKFATARFLIESVKLGDAIDGRIRGNRLPVLLILAENDPVIDNDAVTEVLHRGRQQPFSIVEFEGQLHSVQFDAVDRLAACLNEWISSIEKPNLTCGSSCP